VVEENGVLLKKTGEYHDLSKNYQSRERLQKGKGSLLFPRSKVIAKKKVAKRSTDSVKLKLSSPPEAG